MLAIYFLKIHAESSSFLAFYIQIQGGPDFLFFGGGARGGFRGGGDRTIFPACFSPWILQQLTYLYTVYKHTYESQHGGVK